MKIFMIVVSIPLRGIGRERAIIITALSTEDNKVSIPLRGIGRERLPQPRHNRKQVQPSNPRRSYFDPKI